MNEFVDNHPVCTSTLQYTIHYTRHNSSEQTLYINVKGGVTGEYFILY